ncbi:hypothetical protein D915_003569 [Fasciola hepatica]|uniref:UBA domain-containing protein n=1 Tax=Fasciola hepatica TaxID=6192 RepID=A0A4E0RAY3_FASHE|nr:hypothetical protein D915_003569 [Fasciola hepatica]
MMTRSNFTSFQCSSEDIIRLGWSVSPKFLPTLVQKTAHGKPEEVIPLLLDCDLRESGVPWISDHRKADQLEANGLVVQLVRLRNIAIPQADEDFGTGQGQGTPRLFRLALTDGKNTISALDVDNHDRLSSDTPPGTKIRLLGTVPISMGFLILHKDRFQVLGGSVINLIHEWTMTKQSKVTEGRLKTGEGGPPPFVPFGSKEASALVQSESRFFLSLRRNRGQGDAAFDSFKLATSGSATKENELDASFLERRQGVIAEVKGSGRNANQTLPSANMRFHAGGSKFANLQAEKSQAFDEAVAKLVGLGYPVSLAACTLKICKGDFQASLDRLLASAASGIAINGPETVSSRGGSNIGPRGRGSRRGGGRRGLGGYDPDEEDDPRFDPAAAAAAAGLPSRPSTGLTRLEDLMPDNVARLSTAQTQLQSGPSTAGLAQKRTRLPVGCPILAQNMTGVYEEAVMLGQLSTNGSDKVVLVVYKRQHEGRMEEEEELVPLSLIRTLNKEKITLDMIPPAPAERARVYNIGTTGSRYSDSSPFSNGSGDFGRGFDSQSGYRGSRGRSGHRGFRSRGSSGASGGGRSRGPRRFRGSPRS